MHACSVMFDCLQPFWTMAHQVPLAIEFPRQEYWGGLPFPAPGDLPNPGIEASVPESPALAGRFFINVPPGKPEYAPVL